MKRLDDETAMVRDEAVRKCATLGQGDDPAALAYMQGVRDSLTWCLGDADNMRDEFNDLVYEAEHRRDVENGDPIDRKEVLELRDRYPEDHEIHRVLTGLLED